MPYIRSQLWTPDQGKPRIEYGARRNPDNPINRSLWARWLFNEGAGSTLYGQEPTPKLSVVNSPSWSVHSRFTSGLTFTAGSNHHATLVSTLPATLPVTVLVDFEESSHDYYNQLVAYGDVSGGVGWRIESNGDGGNTLAVTLPNVGNYAFTGITPAVGVPYTAIVVMPSSGAATVYWFNHNTRAVSIVNSSSLGTPVSGSDRIFVGVNVSGGSDFAGFIGRVEIYARALTQTETLSLLLYPYGDPGNPMLLVEPVGVYSAGGAIPTLPQIELATGRGSFRGMYRGGR